MRCLFLSAVIYFVGSGLCSSQTNSFKLEPSIGVGFRTTFMHFFDFNTSPFKNFTNTVLYPYEANIQGLSIHPGITLTVPKSRVRLRLAPSIRKDATYLYPDESRYETTFGIVNGDTVVQTLEIFRMEQHKEWILDINASIHYQLGNNLFGLGYSHINAYKSIINEIGMIQDISFNTYNLHYERIFKEKFGVEFLVHYIGKGDYFFNRNYDFISYNLKLNYYLKENPFKKLKSTSKTP